MSISVDSVVSAMLTSGEAVVVRQKIRIASTLRIPPHVSDQWETAHRLLAIESHDLFSRILGSWVVQSGEDANIGRLTNIMKDMKLLAVADAISKLGNAETPITITGVQKPPISTSSHVTNCISFSFGVKQPNHDFVGRTNELIQLNDYFIQQTQICVVIYAIGGQGKTELSKKFIYNLITANSPPPVVVWLPGESIQKFTSRVLKLAHCLSIFTNDDGKSLPLLRLLKAVMKQLRNQFPTQRWLVVIDNVDEEHLELEKIIKILIDFGTFVLITSRRNDILPGAPRTTTLQLENLSSSDAMLLVTNSLKDTSTEDVTSLCDKVGNHALALLQAVAYIRMQSQMGTKGRAYGISQFLQEFKDCQKLVLKHPVKLVDYNHTIHAIVRATLDSISTKYGKIGQVAQELGIILGLVNPEGIHLDILQKFHNFCGPQWSDFFRRLIGYGGRTTIKDTREAVLLLAKFSMVTLKDDVVSIHRLVQMVLRLDFDVGQTINVLLKNIQLQKSSIEEVRQLISIWEHADHETVKRNLNFAIRIFRRMTHPYLEVELHSFAEKNHTLISQLLGPNHEETLYMEFSIARAIHGKGDYETALTKFRTFHEKFKRVRGEEHLASMCHITSILCHLNRYEEALEWTEKKLESWVEAIGENHVITKSIRSDKAEILANLGRLDEALSILPEVLEWMEVNLGSSNTQTYCTRHTIDSILFRQEQLQEASNHFKLSVEILGEEHAKTLVKKFCLADTYWKLRRREDAMRMMEEVLVSQEKVLGLNHRDTNITRNTLSIWRKKIKDETCLPLK